MRNFLAFSIGFTLGVTTLITPIFFGVFGDVAASKENHETNALKSEQPSTKCLSLDDNCNTANNVQHQRPAGDEVRQSSQARNIDSLELKESLNFEAFNYTSIVKNDDSSSTLRQVLLVHRHGDRTVIDFSPNDPFKDEPFWSLHGLGQLTNIGKKRLYLLGILMRNRYASFLDKSANKNHRTSRSSGSLRCIESAQTFLASFLALDSQTVKDGDALVWDKSPYNRIATSWQPASVMTTTTSIDGMLAESSVCKRLDKEYANFDSTEEAKSLLVKYKHVADVMYSTYGFKIDAFYKWFWASSFIEVEKSLFESRMNPKILQIYNDLQAAGVESFKIYQSTLISRRLRGGLLINDILSQMEKMQSGKECKKFLHYSGHDLTNVILLGMLESFESFPMRPDYASSIIFELHQDEKLNQWFVRVLYLPIVPGQLFELELKSCKKNELSRCTLDEFNNILKPYRLPTWYQWMQECGNDFTQVDPYIVSR